MLLRLTDDDPIGDDERKTALERKFSDVATLFTSLDPKLARVMFNKLARAVLDLEPERRKNLLRRSILPGLLDGRADGSVLADFPDVDLVDSLCLPRVGNRRPGSRHRAPPADCPRTAATTCCR
jgi:hypothetical protein